MPRTEDLPEDIRSLTDQQSHELSDSSARREVDLKLLIADIERLTGSRLKKDRSARIPGVPSAPGSRKMAWHIRQDSLWSRWWQASLSWSWPRSLSGGRLVHRKSR